MFISFRYRIKTLLVGIIFLLGLALVGIQGVGIASGEVSSPTFTLIQEYGGGRVYHVDLYRLNPNEVEELGLEELSENGGLVCIEWADRLPHAVPGAISVRINDLGQNSRELVIGYSDR